MNEQTQTDRDVARQVSIDLGCSTKSWVCLLLMYFEAIGDMGKSADEDHSQIQVDSKNFRIPSCNRQAWIVLHLMAVQQNLRLETTIDWPL